MAEVGTNNIISKAQRNKAQRSFQPVKAQRKLRNVFFFNFWSAAQLSQWAFWFSWCATQFRNCGTAFSYQVKAKPNLRNWNFTTQGKYRTFCNFWPKRVNNLLKKADIYQYFDRNGTKLRSMYRIALLTEKKVWKRSAIKAQQILKALFRNATSAMFQNKKLKRNATSAIAQVAEVALCASNCALPTSAWWYLADWWSRG